MTVKEELSRIKKRNAILKTIEQFSEDQNLIKVEVDDFEKYDHFMQNNPQFDMHTFVKVQDLSGTMLLLKPDITTNIIAQVTKMIDQDESLALYYLDNVYSYNGNNDINVTRQYGVELLGNDENNNEVTLIKTLETLFNTFNLPLVIELGNQAFINVLLENLDVSNDTLQRIKTCIMSKNYPELKILLNASNKSAYKTLLIDLFEKDTHGAELLDWIQKMNLDIRLAVELKTVLDIKAKAKDTVVIDLTLMHQYTYYNGPIFKGYTDNIKTDILRGGRYDTLTKTYGQPTKALGFSLDMDTFIEEVTFND
ncbi:MAG: ATP phosphoribosyltransferase regulatory subunit [Bacillota bacterium]